MGDELGRGGRGGEAPAENKQKAVGCVWEASALRGRGTAGCCFGFFVCCGVGCVLFFFYDGIFVFQIAKKGMSNPLKEDRCGGGWLAMDLPFSELKNKLEPFYGFQPCFKIPETTTSAGRWLDACPQSSAYPLACTRVMCNAAGLARLPFPLPARASYFFFNLPGICYVL